MVWKNLFVGLLISALVSCQPIVPSNPMVSTSTVQPRVTNPDTSSTDYRIFIDHMSVKDLFEGAVMIGKYDALQYYGSPKEAYSFLCCRMAESLEVEEYSRHADWISHFELDMLTPLSLEPYSPLRLNDADIENGNLVFLRQARAYQTQDALLAIENGKSYFNYLILSHTKDGWRIAEINSAYPTENLLGNWSSDATATAQMPSSNAYLETIADTYLSLARVSGLLTRVDLRLRGIINKTVLPDDVFEENLNYILDKLNQPQRVIVEQLLPLPFTDNESSMTSIDLQQHRIVVEARLRVNDDPVVLFFTLERLKDGLQISRITTDYP
mgnify:FL=1